MLFWELEGTWVVFCMEGDRRSSTYFQEVQESPSAVHAFG